MISDAWRKLRGKVCTQPPKAQGRNFNHRPPGFRASGAALTCARPDMHRDISTTGTPYPRHRVLHPKPLRHPDGAPLCPVAYPL
jgi:hypothetical protein